jgi:hypothetical protein
LTVLDECSVTLLLVDQPGFERATAGKDIPVIRRIRGKLVKEKENRDSNEGGEHHDRRTRRHGCYKERWKISFLGRG